MQKLHSIIIAGCPHLNQDTIIIIVTVLVFVFSSTLFFIIGYVCRYLTQKHNVKLPTHDNGIKSSDSQENQPELVYEEIDSQAMTSKDNEEEGVMLEGNKAYMSLNQDHHKLSKFDTL